MSSLRLGVLTTSYPRYPGDASGRFVAELCQWLARRGDRLEVVAPHPARAEPTSGVTVRALRYALRPRLLYGAGAPDNLGNAGAWPQVPAFIGRLALTCRLRSRSWDRVMSHWLLPCGLTAARCSGGLPHLAVAHSSDVHLMSRLRGASLLLRGLARPRTGLILTSEALRPPLARLAHTSSVRTLVENAQVIRMGIDRERLLPPDPVHRARLRQQHGLESRLVVLTLGRLVPVKGIDVLIRAAAPLVGVVVVVAGDGPERERLERLAQQLDAPVRFVGEQLGLARDSWLRTADVFVLPSTVLPDGRTDSAPVALLEAMAAGLPVVASRVGGNAQLVEGAAGLLVTAGHVAPLRRALAVMTDPSVRSRFSRSAREVAKRFAWDRVGQQLRDALGGL